MRFHNPPYPGDSIIRYRPTTRLGPVTGQRQTHSAPSILQRDTRPAALAALDLAEIEASARALRAAAIADLVSRARTWLGTYFEPARRRREEEYLARSQNLAELEYRLRRLERQGGLLHL